jgi:preprotein translocase subunit SecD
LKLNAAGTKRLGDFTRNHIGALLAIVVNGKIVQAPRIQDAIEGGLAVVTGTASTVQEAKDLADLLNAGVLPVDLTLISLEQVPPPRR